jgi:hypothetical protein
VAYILGAGFSAPLGIPVTSNFMEKAEDMWRGGRSEYAYFDEVFHLARSLALVKNYVDADLLNIEEILSILQMRNELQGSADEELFVRFICDVILHHTPPWSTFTGPIASNWHAQMWGTGEQVHPYADFVASLFGLGLKGTAMSPRKIASYGTSRAQYAVITFNYDRVLENLCDNVSGFLGGENVLSFRVGSEIETVPYAEKPSLIKLHGDVKARNIIPPTWSKGATASAVPVWRQAFAALRDATRVRFLGYSLPGGDSYFRYLLKAAATSGHYLKEIDVVCLDPSEEVRSRYASLVVFPKLRFTPRNVLEYLGAIRKNTRDAISPTDTLAAKPYDGLEGAHESFFRALQSP